MKASLICSIVCLGLLVSFCSAGSAQVVGKPASVVVVVKDQTGGYLPGAYIQVLALPNHFEKQLTADFYGHASFELPAGSYELWVSLRSFLPAAKHVELQDGANQRVDVVLELASPRYPGVTGEVTGNFPKDSRLFSPNGRFAIVGIDAETEPYHTVFLEDRALPYRRKLFNYDRHILVMWDRDSKMIVVTDYSDSDNSECRIISVDDKVHPVKVLDLLFQTLDENEQRILRTHLSNRHVYVDAPFSSWWVWPMLDLKISGYGDADPAGFRRYYEVPVFFDPPKLR